MAPKRIPYRLHDDRPVGPIVNVAFTLDMEAFQLLHAAGKNRSRIVRNAIKYYCQDGVSSEGHRVILEKYKEKCIENKILREIINSNLPNVDLEAEIEDSDHQVSSQLEDSD